MATKPTSPTSKLSKREKRALSQRRRRAKEHVLEAETYEEAAARLREAFALARAEASPEAPGQPPAVSAAGDSLAPSETAPVVTQAAQGEPQKPPEPEPAKPAEQASAPAGEAQPDAEPETEEPEFEFDPLDLTETTVDAVDELAVEHLGPEVKLTENKRQKLIRQAKPVLMKFLASKAKSGKVTAETALIVTALGIYGPALLSKYVFNEGAAAQPEAEPGAPRLVQSERTA